MKNAMKPWVWPVALSLVFVFSGCAKDRTALLGMPGGGGCGGGGCGGCGSSPSPAGYAAVADYRATGGATMPQHDMSRQAMASQSMQQPMAASGGSVINNKLCPVMGEPLGSMGGPVPVTVDGETLFVCCRGCVKKVKADPAKYFAIARNQ